MFFGGNLPTLLNINFHVDRDFILRELAGRREFLCPSRFQMCSVEPVESGPPLLVEFIRIELHRLHSGLSRFVRPLLPAHGATSMMSIGVGVATCFDHWRRSG